MSMDVSRKVTTLHTLCTLISSMLMLIGSTGSIQKFTMIYSLVVLVKWNDYFSSLHFLKYMMPYKIYDAISEFIHLESFQI
jgi:hypothetical protein